eukprot:3920071-Prymnesium_polylepis.1
MCMRRRLQILRRFRTRIAPAAACHCSCATVLCWVRSQNISRERVCVPSHTYTARGGCTCAASASQVATAHSMPVSKILKRTTARRAKAFAHRIAKMLLGDQQHLTPRVAAQVLAFRTSHRKAPEAGPPAVRDIEKGATVDLRIEGVFPRTSCFVQVEVDTLLIRWAPEYFISLHTVEEVRYMSADCDSSTAPSWSLKECMSMYQCCVSRCSRASRTSKSSASSYDAGPPAQGSFRSSKLSSVDRSTKLSVADTGSAKATIAKRGMVSITFGDRGGTPRFLELYMLAAKAVAWAAGLRDLLKVVPRYAAPAHWRWSLSCMAATNRRGATGVLRRSNLRALLKRTNANASLGLDITLLDHLIASFQENEHQAQPSFGRQEPGRSSFWRPSPRRRNASFLASDSQSLLTVQHITGLLVQLSTSSTVISDLFSQYAMHGRMVLHEWLEFTRVEQFARCGNPEELASRRIGEVYQDPKETARRKQSFKHAVGTVSAELRSDESLSLLQFALQLLN